MPLTYNSNSPATIDYNSNALAEVTYNGVTVWQAGSSASEFDFTLDSSHLTLDLYLTQSAANAVTIDWGDNSATATSADTAAHFTHTYSAAGNYTVSITCASGESWYPGAYFNYGQSEDDFTFCGVADDATHYSTLTAIRSGNGMTLGGIYCFEYFDALVTADLSKAAGDIASKAFHECTALTTAAFGNGIENVGTNAFENCLALVSLDLGQSLKTIGNTGFQGCSSLTTLVLPATVTSIGGRGFRNCTSLASITCYAVSPPTITSATFLNVPADCAIYVPSGSVATYQAASGWSARAAYIQAIP